MTAKGAVLLHAITLTFICKLCLAEAVAAMKRIQQFLLLPETEEQPQAAEPQAVMVRGGERTL
jgi:hypothetical protein